VVAADVFVAVGGGCWIWSASSFLLFADNGEAEFYDVHEQLLSKIFFLFLNLNS